MFHLLREYQSFIEVKIFLINFDGLECHWHSIQQG